MGKGGVVRPPRKEVSIPSHPEHLVASVVKSTPSSSSLWQGGIKDQDIHRRSLLNKQSIKAIFYCHIVQLMSLFVKVVNVPRVTNSLIPSRIVYLMLLQNFFRDVWVMLEILSEKKNIMSVSLMTITSLSGFICSRINMMFSLFFKSSKDLLNDTLIEIF